MNSYVTQVKQYLLSLQEDICSKLAQEDGKAKFIVDKWQDERGAGITRVISQGAVIEKGGVNFSHVHGKALPKAATMKRPELAGCPFEALGVSLVIHPGNPYAPTSHANIRFISVTTDAGPVWWFGGGFDLTPYYGFEEDCMHWHKEAKSACDPFGQEIYPDFKKKCDDYFYLPHRSEARGIGGLFFDDYSETNFEQSFGLAKSIGDHYIVAYQPILAKRKAMPYGKQEKQFQLLRRGRYVEFNLIYDRGTKFGLQFGGRTESILMSLPAEVRWDYNWKPDPQSKELKLYTHFLVPRDWAGVTAPKLTLTTA